MDKTEFLKIYKQFFPFGDPSRFVDHAFRMFDENQNGKIEFSEFIRALSISSRGTMEEKLIWSFRFYDLDNDGVISRNELLLVVSAIFEMLGGSAKMPPDEDTPEKRVNKLFSLMDKNLDGMIDVEEFKQGSQEDPSIISALSLYNGLI